MKTIVNGVEITPEIAEVLKEWYAWEDIENTQPFLFVKWLSKVQDYLTRVWVDKSNNDEDIFIIKDCVNSIIQIKDDLTRLIPEKNESDE